MSTTFFNEHAANWDKDQAKREHGLHVMSRLENRLVKNGIVTSGSRARILDFGCGIGYSLEGILQKHASNREEIDLLCGVDLSEGMIQQMRDRAMRMGFPRDADTAGEKPRCRPVVLDLAKVLPLSQQQQEEEDTEKENPSEIAKKELFEGNLQNDEFRFDAIVSAMAFHHIGDVEGTVSKLVRHCLREKPGSMLLIVDILKTERSLELHSQHNHHDIDHPGGFTREFWTNILRDKCNMKDLEFETLPFRKPSGMTHEMTEFELLLVQAKR